MSIVPESIRPYAAHVLVRRDDFDDITKGGIIVPDVAKTAATGSPQQLKRGRGVVIAVGPGARARRITRREHNADGSTTEWWEWVAKREPIDVKVGDRVTFSALADGGDLDRLGFPELAQYTLLHERELLGVLEDQ